MSDDDVTMKMHITMEWSSNSKRVEHFAWLRNALETAEAMGLKVTPPTLVDKADASPSQPRTNDPPPRPRGRPRKVTNGSEPEPVPPPASVSLSDDVAGDDVPEDEVEDLGLKEPGLTDAEKHNYAMGGIRNAFNAGRKGEIYALRKKWGVTKFDEIPLSEGAALYKDVVALLEKIGMHI